MNEQVIRQAILDSIAEVAPDADLDALDPNTELRDELDLDSMDFLNVLVALHRRLGIDVPERDYGRLDTLARMVDYLQGLSEQDPARR
jgi:acyl carrier protein